MKKRPPFLEECGIHWDDLVKEYHEEIEKADATLYEQENSKYLEALNELTVKDFNKFEN